MTFTGQLGALLSRPGNIVPGFSSLSGGGAQPIGGIVLTGIAKATVGSVYDVAVGYDQGNGTANMLGYVLQEGEAWTESTQLQDLQRLISVASPNNIDRDFTRWPKVTQGDWSGGERLLFFGNPSAVNNTSRYYSSTGVDVSKPGGLQLLPAAVNVALPANVGTVTRCVMDSDGVNWYLGTDGGSAGNLVRNGGTAIGVGTTVSGNYQPVVGVLCGPNLTFAAVQGQGIWQINTDNTTTQWTNDVPDTTAVPMMAFFDVGGTTTTPRLYYVVGGNTVKYLNAAAGAGAGTQAFTQTQLGGSEGAIHCLTNTASGLFFATSATEGDTNATGYPRRSILYTYDGTNVSRVADIPGRVKSAEETGGVTYILALSYQLTGHYDWTLFTLSGSTLSSLDDLRYQLSDFQFNNATTSIFIPAAGHTTPSLFGDGRFLYVAWPGIPAKRYDLFTTGWSTVGGTGGQGELGVTGHSIVATSGGLIEVWNSNSGLSVKSFSGAMTTGTITTSYFDLNTPSLVKAFKTFEIDLVAPLPTGASLLVFFRIDDQTAFAPASLVQSQTSVYTTILPVGSKGGRIQFLVTLLAGPTNGTPVVRQWAVKATLGRTWKARLSCKRQQRLRNGQVDQQGALARDLISNIVQAYLTSGKVFLYVPSALLGVEQVAANLEEYQWVSMRPGLWQDEEVTLDTEGVMDLTLVESF